MEIVGMKPTLSSVMVSAERVSRVMRQASFFFVPASRKECASTTAPVIHCKYSSNEIEMLRLTWEICVAHEELSSPSVSVTNHCTCSNSPCSRHLPKVAPLQNFETPQGVLMEKVMERREVSANGTKLMWWKG